MREGDREAVEGVSPQRIQKSEQDNPTIGILLCTETDKTIARYSVLNDNKQLFASQYMNYLPSEEELIQVIEQQREIFLSQNKT